MARSFEANSSFDNPATNTWPSTYCKSVIDSCRSLLPRLSTALGPGALFKSTLAYGMLSSASKASFPAAEILASRGSESGPRPRDALRYTTVESGCTATSLISNSSALIPTSAAEFER